MTTAQYAALKPYFVMLYGLYGMFCLYAAARASRRASASPAADTRGGWAANLLLLGIAALLLIKFAFSESHLLLATAAIAATIFVVRHAASQSALTLLQGAAVAVLVSSLAWWQIAPAVAAPLPLAVFAAILLGISGALSVAPAQARAATVIPVVAYAIAGFLLLIDLGNYRLGEPNLFYMAHHWGAFIGPALHLKAGLVPYYDIPLQYGLGPTLMIAASCRGSDCWTGMEIIVVTMIMANALIVLAMALTTRVPRGWLWNGAVTCVVFAAVFLWPGYLVEGNSLLAYPSSSAIRYLPLTVVAALLFYGRPAMAAFALVPASLWSPETAGMSIAVFGVCETARMGVLRAALRTICILVGSYAGLVLIHHAIFGVWMEPAAFLEYVLHVPSPLPIIPISDAMLLAAVLALGAWLLVHGTGDAVTARRDLTVTILLFATTSFWLGRSHENNICNMAPFLVLVALRALDRPSEKAVPLARVVSFGLATSVALLALSPWRSKPYDPRATLDIHVAVADIPSLEPDIERIRQQIANPEGLGIADFGASDTRHPSEAVVWTPMDPSSLWPYVPAERRQLYIQRSSARLHRSGWAIFDADRQFLLSDFQAGYTIATQRSFAGSSAAGGASPAQFLAVCFTPNADRDLPITGPSCPSDNSWSSAEK